MCASYLSCRRAALLAASWITASLTVAVATPAEWPLIRRDAQNTAASPLKSQFHGAPIPCATVPLGGAPGDWALLRDLDNDGMDEIIATSGGAIRVYAANGQERWRTIISRGSGGPIGAWDLDEDGSLELLCTSNLPATAHILSGTSGKILWEKSFPGQMFFGQGSRVTDLNGDGHLDWLLLGNGAAESDWRAGSAYSFENGVTQPRLLYGPLKLPFNHHYRPQTVVTDIDGDQKSEVVVASATHWENGLTVAAFDAATGVLKRLAGYPNGNRNYGHLQAIDTGHKPQKDVLVMGMLGRAHITYLVNDATRMHDVWHVNETYNFAYNPVVDVDGDGRLELVYTRINNDGAAPKADDIVIIIRDLETGTLEQEAPGLRVIGTVDAQTGGKHFLVAETIPEHTLVLYDPSTTEKKPLGPAGAKPCMWTKVQPLTMMNEAVPGRSGYDILAHDIDADHVPDLFMTTSDAIVAVNPFSNHETFRLPFGKDRAIHPIAVGKLLAKDRDALLLAGQDGYLVAGPDGAIAATISLHTCGPVVAVAGKLGKNEPLTVLFNRPNGTVVALDGAVLCRGEIKERFSKPGLQGFQTPTLEDVDGDGVRDVVLCDTSTAEPVIVSGAGEIKRRLPAMPYDGSGLDTGTAVISASGSAGHRMLNAVSCNGPNHAFRTSTTYDLKTGKIIWQRVKGAVPRKTACAADLNKDGVDDFIWMHNFDVIASDGRTGKDLWATYDIIPGYCLATFADLDASGTPSILLSGGYMSLYRYDQAGKQIWKTPDMDYNSGMAAAVADVDGDGKLDCGVAFTNRFACYDPASGIVKWEIQLPGPGTDVAAVDVTGDGRSEFLFGCMDGRLYAIGANGSTGHIVWTVPLGAPTGPPSIADLDEDGQAEIILSTADGWLHVLRGK